MEMSLLLGTVGSGAVAFSSRAAETTAVDMVTGRGSIDSGAAEAALVDLRVAGTGVLIREVLTAVMLLGMSGSAGVSVDSGAAEAALINLRRGAGPVDSGSAKAALDDLRRKSRGVEALEELRFGGAMIATAILVVGRLLAAPTTKIYEILERGA